MTKLYGYNDNEAARISFMHGTSKRMSHLSRHAGVHFDFIREAGLIPKHLSRSSNVTDIFTKVLTAKRMVWLIRRIFGLDHPMIDAMEAATRKMTPHQQVVVSNVFQHDSFCQFAAVREYGVRLLLSCPCRGEALKIVNVGDTGAEAHAIAVPLEDDSDL